MVDFLTRDDFRNVARNLSAQDRTALLERAEGRSPHGATFLSHSSKDQELLVGVIRILENHGAIVYVDKKDPNLPPYTSKETASTLKSRIKQSRKFVLLATENSKKSKWVPWELGIADGYKDLNNIALFPVVENQHEDSWTEWEYLGLYDRVVWGTFKGKTKNEWMVWDKRKNTATGLSEWLSG